MNDTGHPRKQTVSYSMNIAVWIALVALTSLTVYVAGIHLDRFGFIINILIASIKATLVIYIFMHLRYEPLILKIMLFIVILTLTSIIILTFSDVLYRY